MEPGSQELASCAITARPPQHDSTGPRHRACEVFQDSCYTILVPSARHPARASKPSSATSVTGIQLESRAREETGRFRDVKRCVATGDGTRVSSPRKCDIWVSSCATSCAPVSMVSHARFRFCLGNNPFSRKKVSRLSKLQWLVVVRGETESDRSPCQLQFPRCMYVLSPDSR